MCRPLPGKPAPTGNVRDDQNFGLDINLVGAGLPANSGVSDADEAGCAGLFQASQLPQGMCAMTKILGSTSILWELACLRTAVCQTQMKLDVPASSRQASSHRECAQ